MNSPLLTIENSGLATPWFFVGMFVVASLLMVWRLEAMSDKGFEGTILGTLIMPYCSGLGNLVFAVLLGLGIQRGDGTDVLTNCLVNNVTNLTLLIGVPGLIWGINVIPQKKPSKKKAANQEPQLNRLSLLLTMAAVLFFTGVTWALARDGQITFTDGLVLVSLFLFWQCIHVFEVLKNNVRQNQSLPGTLIFDFLVLAAGAYAVYLSIDWLVAWISTAKSSFVKNNMGWLTGWLMVLPNALLALYYGWKKRAEVIYSSQIGDGHVCIPLCIGLFALFRPITVPSFFEVGVLILFGATVVHFLFVGFFGKLPRLMGLVLILAYIGFTAKGLFR